MLFYIKFGLEWYQTPVLIYCTLATLLMDFYHTTGMNLQIKGVCSIKEFG